MKILIILNESPLSNERAYNALRIGVQFQKQGNHVNVYLLSDGVYCALDKQTGSAYPIGNLVADILAVGGQIRMCTSCGTTRGIADASIIQGTSWTNLKTLTDWTLEADKVLTF